MYFLNPSVYFSTRLSLPCCVTFFPIFSASSSYFDTISLYVIASFLQSWYNSPILQKSNSSVAASNILLSKSLGCFLVKSSFTFFTYLENLLVILPSEFNLFNWYPKSFLAFRFSFKSSLSTCIKILIISRFSPHIAEWNLFNFLFSFLVNLLLSKYKNAYSIFSFFHESILK